MSLPIGVVLGVTNIAYQTHQSLDLVKKVLMRDNEDHVLHRATPFVVTKAERLSSGATDSAVLEANIKTCVMGSFATLAHGALSFPKHSKPLTASLNQAIKCNKILGVTGMLTMGANLYFQNKLSYKAVINNYLDDWSEKTIKMKTEWAKEKKD